MTRSPSLPLLPTKLRGSYNQTPDSSPGVKNLGTHQRPALPTSNAHAQARSDIAKKTNLRYRKRT
eukprot:51455-Hanusia_phi.AAC.1